jgi:hypothetical protein
LGEPQNLRADDITPTAATLSWDAVEGATGYEVVVGSNRALPVDGVSHEVERLIPGTEYTWKVRATRGTNNGQWATGTFQTAARATGEWVYGDVLGNYSAAGVPSLWSMDNETPGPTTWRGSVLQPKDENDVPLTDRYEITNAFGAGEIYSGITAASCYLNVVEQAEGGVKLYLDDVKSVSAYNIEGDGVYVIAADVLYADIFPRLEIVERGKTEVVWDNQARTLTFAGEYNGRPIAVGLFAWTGDNKPRGTWTDYYTDLVLTLDAAGRAARVSGTRVDTGLPRVDFER